MKEPEYWNENKSYGGKTFSEETRASIYIIGIILLMAALFWVSFIVAAIGVALGWW